jgi:hypothetical protein
VLHGRIVIPEPAWWDPQSPFLYYGPAELWEEGKKVDQAHARFGLRHVQVGAADLKLNGRPLRLRAVRRETCTEDEMRQLRESGINLLVIPAGQQTTGLLETADRIGMLVLFLVRATDPEPRAEGAQAKSATKDWMPTVSVGSPSLLGYLVRIDDDRTVQFMRARYEKYRTAPAERYFPDGNTIWGVLLTRPTTDAELPEWARLTVCPDPSIPVPTRIPRLPIEFAESIDV